MHENSLLEDQKHSNVNNNNNKYEDGADSDWCGISSKKRLQK